MDKLKNEEVNNGKTEYGLTEQTNTGSKLRKPPLEKSEDGLLCVPGEVESRKSKVEGQGGSFLPVEVLRDGARGLGIELGDEQLEQLDAFAHLLVETNRSLNLTRITDPTEIVTNHYLDSLTCLAAAEIKPNAQVIDIGTGAGFPGIPIKIARPDLAVTLLDSSMKKLRFIERAVETIGLHGIALLHSRAEEAGREAEHREAYDVAFARAVADMKVLVELALPLVRIGGMLIAQKSEGTDEEIDSARALVGQLGGKIKSVRQIPIPSTDITRRLVVISKVKQTPPKFPRSYSRISHGNG